MLDVRGTLRTAKTRFPVYYRTDTHWNSYGAYLGYRDIVEELSKGSPGLRPLPEEAFDRRLVSGPGWDLAEMLGMEDVLTEDEVKMQPRTGFHARQLEPGDWDPFGHARPHVPRVVTERDSAQLERLVMFRDSAANALIPYLSEHFRRAVYLWQDDFDTEVIERERPQVVIQEIKERRLISQGTLPDNPPSLRAASRVSPAARPG